MDKRKTAYLTIALGILFLVTLVIAQRTLKQANTIILPEQTTESDAGGETESTEHLNVLSVTPETVQAAISTLSRPVSYRRTQTVETFWNGGESSSISQVCVSGGVTRIDTALGNNSMCHTLLTADKAAVWYDDDEEWALLRSDSFSADSLQRMPTYETVLQLPSSSIEQAEYTEKNGVYCIYVKTQPDKDGYADEYWVSAQSGLLLISERTCHGELIYRFTSADPDDETPEESLFLLPDGSRLG